MKMSPSLKMPVFIILLISLANAAGAQETPVTADVPEAFDADSFFGNSGDGNLGEFPEGVDENTASVTGDTRTTGTSAVYVPPSRQVSGLVFSGEATTDLAYSLTEPFDSSARTGSYTGVSSLRLDATGGDRNEAKIEASVIVRMIYGDAAEKVRDDLTDTLASEFSGSADMVAALLLGSSGPLMMVDLKKLYLSVYTSMADISVGRMIVNYGRGTVFSPVDLFSSVDTGDISLGRTGNDALRVVFPFGNFSGLDLVSTIAGSPEQSIAGGRLFGNAFGWDFGFSAFRDGSAGGEGDLVIGLDFKGDIEFGVSAEALARLPFDAGSPEPSEAVYSLMGGLDYSIKGEWFFDLEYLWNIRAGTAYPVGGFRYEHNLFASLSWKPDDLTTLDVRSIIVPAEALGQLSLGVSRSIASGASLMGFAVYTNGNVKGTQDLGSALNAAPAVAGLAVLSMGARLSVAY